MKNPWLVNLWLILLNGVPHDHRGSRTSAFALARVYRTRHPHSTWTVKRGKARIIVTEQSP